MAPKELRSLTRQQPFRPFRLVMTDGASYEIRHPDLLMVGERTATVGLVCDPSEDYYDLTTLVDLLHIVRTEPLEMTTA